AKGAPGGGAGGRGRARGGGAGGEGRIPGGGGGAGRGPRARPPGHGAHGFPPAASRGRRAGRQHRHERRGDGPADRPAGPGAGSRTCPVRGRFALKGLPVFLDAASLLVPLLALAGQDNGRAAAGRAFRDYLEADWKAWMHLYPELATAVGYPGENRRWSDDSPEGLAAKRAHLAGSLATLRSF